ncbi:MAG: hypothetical protein ABFD91_10790 [Anaerohalosphaeraceae bacterium]
MRTQSICLIIICITAPLLVSGCGRRTAIVKDYYMIQSQRSMPPSAERSRMILEVVPFSIGAGYQSKGLVYYLGNQKYDSDFYSEYFMPPAQMITVQTENWLTASGLFAQVLPVTSLVDSTHVLEGNVRQIYYDIQDSSHYQAVLDITFYLLAQKDRSEAEIYFTKNYRTAVRYQENNQQQAVNAMQVCLKEILTNLENDLTDNLKTSTSTPRNP